MDNSEVIRCPGGVLYQGQVALHRGVVHAGLGEKWARDMGGAVRSLCGRLLTARITAAAHGPTCRRCWRLLGLAVRQNSPAGRAWERQQWRARP